jgi:hypothetical protein
MKTKVFDFYKGFFAILFLLGSVVACDNHDPASDFSAQDSGDAESEAADEATSDDAEDMAFTAMSAEAASGGKVATLDERLSCAVVTRTGDKTAGTVRIDFGGGCKDHLGRVRRGAIVVVYTGVWFEAGSTWSMSFENYFVNDVQFAGTRTVKNITTNVADSTRLRFQVDMEDGTATWPDGRVARRRLHHIREHICGPNHVLLRLIIYGTASGNHRDGRGFHIEILEPLVYDRKCFAEGVIIPVKGKKLIKYGDRQITIDYGDGRCDNIVTLININGQTKDIRVGLCLCGG